MNAVPPAGAARIDAYRSHQAAAVHALNAAAVPAVNDLAPGALAELLTQAERVRIARSGSQVDGFIVLFVEGARYDSPNYRWFAARYRRFVYVDRVVVAAHARRRGLGRAFYADAWRLACARGVPLACEVNIRPPNPGSMAFHESFGFRAVATQRTEGGTKEVSLMLREDA